MLFYFSPKFYLSCILSMTASGLTFAEDQNLEPMVVVETRTPQPLSETSPWVTRTSGYDLDQRQIIIWRMHYIPSLEWRLQEPVKWDLRHHSSVEDLRAIM